MDPIDKVQRFRFAWLHARKGLIKILQIIVVFLMISEIYGSQAYVGAPASGGAGGARATQGQPGLTSGSEVEIKPGDVYIDKFTDKFEYDKGEPIRVILRIHAIEPQAGLKFSNGDVYIFEELYSNDSNNNQQKIYDFVKAIPDYESFKMGEIVWHFKNLEDLIKAKQIEYIIKTNKSDFYSLGNTRLESHDKIIFYQSRPQFWVINRPPIIDNITLPSTPIWQGEDNYIECTVHDPDNDNIKCNLYYNGQMISTFSKSRFLDSFNYTWDISYCNAGNYIFKIKASDGNSTSETDGTMIEIRKKMFGVLHYPDEYKIPVFSGVAAGIILSGLRGIMRRSNKMVSEPAVEESPEEKSEPIDDGNDNH